MELAATGHQAKSQKSAATRRKLLQHHAKSKRYTKRTHVQLMDMVSTPHTLLHLQ